MSGEKNEQGSKIGLQERYEEVMDSVNQREDKFKLKPHKECAGGLPKSLSYFPPEFPLGKKEAWLSSVITCNCPGCGSDFVLMKKSKTWIDGEEYRNLLKGEDRQGDKVII